jgi:predicted metal-dependent hydrolase
MTVVIRFGRDTIQNKESYDMAMNVGMSDELAVKYSAYYAKKTKMKKTGRTANKDSSQTKVYRAEWAFEKKFPQVKEKMTEKEVQKFFKRVVNSKTYEKLRGDTTKPDLSFMKDMGGYSRTAGRAWRNNVTLSPSTGMNKYVVLHELAHTTGNMHHDVSFRQDLIKLVSRFLGVDCAKGLKKEFKEKKLKMTISQNIMSPLKWLENYNKMMKVRESL